MRVARLLCVAALCGGGGGSGLAQSALDRCGVLTAGVECVLFEDAAGARFVLDKLGGFVVGDRVRVTGLFEPGCISICQEGIGCITVARISYCEEPVTLSGRLVAGVECVLFEDARGEQYVLDSVGDFRVGDRVCVSGRFERDCVTICQQTEGCLRDNTIRAAPTDGSCRTPGDGSPVCGLVSTGLLTLAATPLLLSRRGAARGAQRLARQL